jgi:hypothetical protein
MGTLARRGDTSLQFWDQRSIHGVFRGTKRAVVWYGGYIAADPVRTKRASGDSTESLRTRMDCGADATERMPSVVSATHAVSGAATRGRVPDAATLAKSSSYAAA